MGYLAAQIFVCLLIAFALGLLLGWLLWHGEAEAPVSRIAEGELDAARQRIRTLEADLADCRDTPTAATPVSAPPPVQTPTLASAPVLPPPPAVASGGVLGFGPPAAAPVDDLKAISGVGPVIEKQLAGLGIVTYHQIATLSPSDAQRVGEALGVFSNRISDEDWTAQAARLHRETYGADDARG